MLLGGFIPSVVGFLLILPFKHSLMSGGSSDLELSTLCYALGAKLIPNLAYLALDLFPPPPPKDR